MNNCKDCKHWKRNVKSEDEDDNGVEYDSNHLCKDPGIIPNENRMHWGICQLISHCNNDLDSTKAYAFTCDASYYDSSLNTREDFGCILYEKL